MKTIKVDNYDGEHGYIEADKLPAFRLGNAKYLVDIGGLSVFMTYKGPEELRKDFGKDVWKGLTKHGFAHAAFRIVRDDIAGQCAEAVEERDLEKLFSLANVVKEKDEEVLAEARSSR